MSKQQSEQSQRGGSEPEQGEYGGLFSQAAVASAPAKSPVARASPPVKGGISVAGVTRAAPVVERRVGKGPVPVDPRKFRYDVNRGRAMPALDFGASRADRMDASDAGDMLERIHELFGIDRESENIVAAFDKALFFEHTINGASLLQSSRGVLSVGSSTFELSLIKQLLGVDQRRFFRAFSDEITAVNREVLAGLDPYNAGSVEKHGQLIQVAVERGLQKFPHLAHDSSDAGLVLSVEERVALMASKRLVLPSVTNNADQLHARAAGTRPVASG